MKRKIILFFIILFGCGIVVLSYLAMRSFLFNSGKNNNYLPFSIKVTNRKIIFIGINGLDWKLLQRFSAEGDITVLPKLMQDGSYGLISTLFFDDEDAVWTTISTGYLPENHGIKDNIKIQQSVSAKSENMSPWKYSWNRKRWAFWEIISYFNMDSTTVGWPVSYPADTVKGILVSDRIFLINPDRKPSMMDGLCYPSSMLEKFYPVIESCQNSCDDRFNSYFKPDEENLKTFLSLTWEDSLLPVPHQFLSRTTPIESLKKSFYKDILNYELLHFCVKEFGQKTLTACYFESIDRVSHIFGISAVDNSSKHNTMKKRQAFEAGYKFLKSYYQYFDRLIGSILNELDSKTTLFIVSGHGFNLNNGDHKDCPPGWFLIRGPNIREKKNIETVAISDIAPTLLYLSDIPLPDDIDGEIIVDAFTLSHLEKHKISYWSESNITGLPKTRNIEPLHSSTQP
ncbi:MAG: hypothetical protein A2161_14900 [Candidatus Schekmanbacteria bacterium RBG_13_48_7]|uniref:Sulfatase N-terminal domain-containing protein n=1 Tax=Candidatus Schekmanbacteria bacterium RBG_13_48_7 TaxID=1817878 RepID=A0A1F7RZK4_9BACT|nr:MAG: hypothetical protein A2161_14900 [Candidatus Schekmanbacteria bacterium RBG_13_48_7]